MSDPCFLTVEQVEALHRRSLELFGGSDGTRDQNAFESAVAHPRNVYSYSQGDLFDIAAAYCFHLAQAQAFVDGNKRTGAAAALVFLEINGYSITGDSMKIHAALISIARGETGKPDLADLLRELTSK